jgi:hypothetical protein
MAVDLAEKFASSDMCQSVDSNYGEKVEWWFNEAKDMVDAAKFCKSKGEHPPYLNKI